MTRRFILASLRHESNTFSPIQTKLEDFNRGSPDGTLMAGPLALEILSGLNTAFAGMYDTIKEMDAEISVPCAFSAKPQGPVTSHAFEDMAERMVSDVKKGCDALFLDAHGAMVTETYSDAEGELLKRIRMIAPDLPIAVALDFHANLSPDLMDNVTTIAGYRTYPHIDTYETGQRASRALTIALEGGVRPVVSWGALPMLTHMEKQTPSRQPMKDIMDRAIQAEAAGDVLTASVFGGFPLADIPHLGLTVAIVTDNNKAAGDGLRDALLEMAWQRRAGFVFDNEPIADTISKANKTEGHPIVLVDHGDNHSAGALTDNMDVLEELIRQDLQDACAGPFCDPQAVQEMMASGVGSKISLNLGGNCDIPNLNLSGRPLMVTGTVVATRDGGTKTLEPCPTSFFSELGPAAVLDLGAVQVLVSSKPYEPIDVGCFVYAGIDPADKKFVLIKSRQNFRAGFQPIAQEIFLVAGPGVGNSNFETLPYKNIVRPMFPLDPGMPKAVRGN